MHGMEDVIFHYNLTKITGCLHENQQTFTVASHSILLGMINVSDENCRENQNTYFIFCNIFFFENRTLYEIK